MQSAEVLLGLLLCKLLVFFPHTAPQSSDWTAGEPMGSRAAGYLNSPHIASTKPDNIPWLFKHYPLRRVCHQQVCSVTAAAREQGRLFNPFFSFFYHVKYIQDGNLPLLFTSGSLLIHLLIEGKRSVFNHEQSCCGEVWHAASSGGQQESGDGEEQIGLRGLTSEQFNRRREHRPAAMPGRQRKQLSYQVQKIWVRPWVGKITFNGMMSS